jgi:hypothetical protein
LVVDYLPAPIPQDKSEPCEESAYGLSDTDASTALSHILPREILLFPLRALRLCAFAKVTLRPSTVAQERFDGLDANGLGKTREVRPLFFPALVTITRAISSNLCNHQFSNVG